MKKKYFLFFLLLSTPILFISCSAKMLIKKPSRDSKEIVLEGRFNFTNEGAEFDWPLSSVNAAFTGNRAKIDMEANGNDFNLYIDGEFKEIVNSFPYYIKINDPGSNTHTIRIEKRNEVWGKPSVFKSISIPEENNFVSLPQKKYKLLVIGDSISAGYGNEGPGLTCDNVRKYTNPALAYAALCAKELDASIHLIAISGKGLIRNYGEPLTRSAEPMPVIYERILFNDPASKWDSSMYTPDMVVINLGTNDFSTEPKPEQELFTKELDIFIRSQRLKYPLAHIFVICGPMHTPPQCTAVQDAVEKSRNRKDKKVHYVAFPRNPMEYLGCDWHPNVEANRIMAGILVDEIKRQLEKHQ